MIAWLSLVLAVAAVGVAATRTVPSAVRLGTRRDTPSKLRACWRDRLLAQHLFCFASIAGLIGVQLAGS